MLLNLLWRHRCHPRAAAPDLQAYLTAFGFAVVTLECSEARPCGRILFADEELMPGLTVADALCGELDLIVEEDAALLLVPPQSPQSPNQAVRIAAELLYAAIARGAESPQHIAGLFDWAFRSLSETWRLAAPLDPALAQACTEALHAVLDYPAERAALSLPAYLHLIDPDYRAHEIDPDLAARLSQTRVLSDWQHQLTASFAQVRCRGTVT